MPKPLQIAILSGAVLLGGCNLVISEQPWFTEGQAGPRLRPGVWVNLDPAGCTFDFAQPVENWPECAEPMIVRGDDYILREEADREGPPRWQTVRHLVVAGTPLIDQIEWRDKDETGERTRKVYFYTGLAPTAYAADGAITEVKRWLVQCGPMNPAPRKPKSGPRPQTVTKRPFPGLKVEGTNCTAANAEAVRGAAKASEAISGNDRSSPMIGRWVRDGSS